jgi:formylglycine-generating enzyme required for sulfatase activity
MFRKSHRVLARALLSRAALGLVAAWLGAAAAAAVEIDYVVVGDPNNPSEPNNIYGLPNLGTVSAVFRLGKYEVTNAQYVEFLNAKAASDPYALYDGRMESDTTHGGIERSGSEGSYTYAVRPGFATRPVVYVNFFDALRFTNWLHNGQGSADTEAGAYTLTPNPGNLPIPANGSTVVREPNASVFLPDENEWYKAAYYAGGPNYFNFPTRSSTAPTAQAPPGGTNSANYSSAAGGSHSAVGAYGQSGGPYATFDQGGNVQEWVETLNSGFRVLRGGHFANGDSALSALGRSYWFADGAFEHTGFRVAAAVAPPSVPAPPRGLGKIMPLGDSLTQSQNDLFSYRYYLWTRLLDQGVDFDFVGTLLDNGINGFPPWPSHQGQAFDQHHEGHSGLRTDEISAQLGGWMAGYVPDVVLLIAGTNDALQGRDPALAIASLKTIIGQLRARNANVAIFLCKVPPVRGDITWQGVPVNNAINTLNGLIPSIPNDPAMAGARITIVDLNTGFDLGTDFRSDGLHPNAIGEQKMAARLFEALQMLALTSTTGADATGNLTVTFLRIKSLFQLSYTVEVSGNLQQWLSGPAQTEESGTPIDHYNGTETVTIRDRKSPATDGQRFIRLRLSY